MRPIEHQPPVPNGQIPRSSTRESSGPSPSERDRYGIPDFFDLLREVRRYKLRDVVAQIKTRS